MDLKLQVEQDALLHVEDLLLRVGVVGEIDKVLDRWWVNLFILRGDK